MLEVIRKLFGKKEIEKTKDNFKHPRNELIYETLKDKAIFKTNLQLSFEGELSQEEKRISERFFVLSRALSKMDNLDYYCFADISLENAEIVYLVVDIYIADEVEKVATGCNITMERIIDEFEIKRIFKSPYIGIREPNAQNQKILKQLLLEIEKK